MALKYNDPSFDTTEAVLEKEYNLPPGLMAAIRTRGERSNNDQVSPKGARGVYQFIPATWNKFADPGTDPTDPDASATAAARYLSYAMKQYDGNVGAVVAEYNGGPKAAKSYLRTGDPGNKETRGYVQRVMGALNGVTPQATNQPSLTDLTGVSEEELQNIKDKIDRDYNDARDKGLLIPGAPAMAMQTLSGQAPQTAVAHAEQPVTTSAAPSPFGGDEYASPSMGQSMQAMQPNADLNNINLDDMASLEDNMLESRVGAIVDEVLNG